MTNEVSATSRRCFLCSGARVLAAGALASAGASLLTKAASGAESLSAADVPESKTVDVRSLTAPGQSLLAPFQGPDGASVLIVRETNTAYAALSLLCTHMGCPVNLPIHGILTCPCHGSEFDLEGKVQRGPAAYPLGRYTTRYNAKQATVTVTLTLPAADG
jgi:Rieske Fe-S protein